MGLGVQVGGRVTHNRNVKCNTLIVFVWYDMIC